MRLDPAPRRFFAASSGLHLTQREKEDVRAALKTHIALRGADVHLTADEHAEGKDALATYVRAHPLEDRRRASWFGVMRTPLLSRMSVLALSALVVVFGGGAVVASAAESALPGDALYTVKVNVLEPLRERMLATPEKRAAWKVRKVERRIAEAHALSVKGRLSESRRNLIEHAIIGELDALRSSGPGTDREMTIASEQVLEETMMNAVMEHRDVSTEDREWDHLTSFIRDRRSDVRDSVRENLRIAEDLVAAPAPQTSKASKSVRMLMGLPSSLQAEDASSSLRVRMQERSEKSESEGGGNAQEKKPRSRQGRSSMMDYEGNPLDSSLQPLLPVGVQAQHSADLTVQTSSVSSVDPGPEESQEEVIEEEVLDRLRETREDIREELRDFQEEGGLLP